MSLLAIQYRLVPEAPVLVAANREADYQRSSQLPSIQSGKPRVLCPIDEPTQGTWLGVNQNGLFVGCTRRPKRHAPALPESRTVLCRQLLMQPSARAAVELAQEALETGTFDGVNYVVADAETGWVVQGGDEIEAVPLEDGLSIIGECDVNDMRNDRVSLAYRLLTLQTLDSPVKFLAVASKVFAKPPTMPGRPQMVLHNHDRGTVSSALIALGKKPRDAIFQFANGSPDRTDYEDYSPFLRDILSRGLRENRMRQKAS